MGILGRLFGIRQPQPVVPIVQEVPAPVILYHGKRPPDQGPLSWCPICGEWEFQSIYSDSCTRCANYVEAHKRYQRDPEGIARDLRTLRERYGVVKGD